MVRVNLEQDCRVVLLPVSKDVKDFETGVVRGVEGLLCVCVANSQQMENKLTKRKNK